VTVETSGRTIFSHATYTCGSCPTVGKIFRSGLKINITAENGRLLRVALPCSATLLTPCKRNLFTMTLLLNFFDELRRRAGLQVAFQGFGMMSLIPGLDSNRG
jgi:hypothetical protein